MLTLNPRFEKCLLNKPVFVLVVVVFIRVVNLLVRHDREPGKHKSTLGNLKNLGTLMFAFVFIWTPRRLANVT